MTATDPKRTFIGSAIELQSSSATEIFHMSRAISIALLTVITGCYSATESGYFEGTVTVGIEVESKTDRLPEDLLYFWHGTTENRTYKNGDFRFDSVDGATASTWYVRSENREYVLRTCDQYISFVDVGNSNMSIIAVEQPQVSKEIAGYHADAIELHLGDDDGSVTIWRYWYAPELPVNPEWFAEYRAAGSDVVYEYIDSLVIGFESESPFTNIRKFATKIQRRSVSDDELALPDMEKRHLTFEEQVGLTPCLPDARAQFFSG